MTDIVAIIRPKSKGEAVVMIAAHKLHTAADEIERLRWDREQIHDLLEEAAEVLPSGYVWGLVRAALEKSVCEAPNND